MVQNKQLMLTSPTVHYALLFCIELCSVHLASSADAEQDLQPEPDDKCSLREGYVPDLLKRSIINPQPKVSPPQEIQSDLRRDISNTRKSVSSDI